MFVFHHARGLSVNEAAAKAGYDHPETEGSRLARTPYIQDALNAEVTRVFSSELGPHAVKALKAALTGERVPWSAKIQAAKVVVSRIPEPKENKQTKALSERSIEELEDLLAQLDRAVAPLTAKVIDNPPASPLGLDD